MFLTVNHLFLIVDSLLNIIRCKRTHCGPKPSVGLFRHGSEWGSTHEVCGNDPNWLTYSARTVVAGNRSQSKGGLGLSAKMAPQRLSWTERRRQHQRQDWTTPRRKDDHTNIRFGRMTTPLRTGRRQHRIDDRKTTPTAKVPFRKALILEAKCEVCITDKRMTPHQIAYENNAPACVWNRYHTGWFEFSDKKIEKKRWN